MHIVKEKVDVYKPHKHGSNADDTESEEEIYTSESEEDILSGVDGNPESCDPQRGTSSTDK